MKEGVKIRMSFKKQCDRVFDKKINVNNDFDKILEIEKIVCKKLDKELAYVLTHYGHVFLKENFGICSKYHSPIADENGTEPFLYFISIDGKDNFFNIYETYNDQLPLHYYPIALADGGNLICIDDKTENIYLWIHDDVQNMPFQIFDTFEEMIMGIKKVDEDKSKELGVDIADVKFSDEFYEALKAMKKQ